MATLGNSNQIIVGAAQIFVSKQGALEWDAANEFYSFGSGSVYTDDVPDFEDGTRYADTLETSYSADWRNVGYTMNGLEVQFQPDFGEVQVDQLLDVAKLYKQGMQVNMVTAFAEATLENLLVSIAGTETDLDDSDPDAVSLNMSSGELGSVPVERAIIAVGPGSGDPRATGADQVERVYIANRALSIDSVTVSAKRDEPSMFEVSFRMLPAGNGSYGRIVDRRVGA
jgi:hypothetical protein